jgi:RNA polymerase sigma factor (sigma-70 family)
MSVKSSLGMQLRRAELYSISSDGKPIKWRKRGNNEVPIRETRSTPNSTHGFEDTEEISRALATLTEEERRVIYLQEFEVGWREERWTVPAGDLEQWLRKGYVLVPGSEQTQQRAGLPPIQCLDVAGKERIAMTHEEIASCLGLSVRQVHRRVSSARRKLRGAW